MAADRLAPPPELDLPPVRWWLPVVVGVPSLLAGVVAIAWPGPTLLLLGICFGALLVVAGGAGLVGSLGHSSASGAARALDAVLGLLTVLAGALLLVRPGASVLAVALVLGLWFLVSGCVGLARGVVESDGRIRNLGLGLLEVVAGALILAQPGIGVVGLAWIVGIAFILRGVFTIGLGLMLRSLVAGDRT